ncbi:MAG: PKD domain-containing protein [bacterium]
MQETKRTPLLILSATLCLLLHAGCGSNASGNEQLSPAGNGNLIPDGPGLGGIPAGQQFRQSGNGEEYEEVLGNLQAELRAALAAQPSAAQSGSGALDPANSVFSLRAEELELDGERLVRLLWTDNLQGDYNGNGLVENSDLVPLAANFGQEVGYVDGSAAGDPLRRPAGDFSTDPLNWRLARIDGDHNGLLALGDLATIARHYGERLDGYRVYRRLPAAEPELLPWPNAPEAPLSVALRDGSSPGLGIQQYIDYAPVDGAAEYFVTAYNVAEDEEGPASNPAGYFHNTPPVASFTIDDQFGSVPQKISFDASASYDDTDGIILYEWDLDGDGQLELSGQELKQVSGYYDNSVGIAVSLRVTDEHGSVDWTSRQLLVGEPPLAVLQASSESGISPLELSFSFADSFSPQGLGLQLHFRLSSTDATLFDDSVAINSVQSFSLQTGVHTGTLTVSDEYGGVAVDSRTVTVAQSPQSLNQRPVAAVKSSRLSADPGQQISFSGSESFDPEGSALEYSWSVDNPFSNELDEDFANSEMEFDYAFETGGTKLVELEVNDSLGATDSDSLVLDIAPFPVLVWNFEEPATVLTDEQLRFRTNSCYSLVGGALSYQWTAPDHASQNFSTSDYFDVSFDEPGTYEINLRLRDVLNQSTYGSFTVNVLERPQASVQLDHQYGLPGRSVTLDASASASIHAAISEYRWYYTWLGQYLPDVVQQDPGLDFQDPGDSLVKTVRLVVVDELGYESDPLSVDIHYGWHDYYLDSDIPTGPAPEPQYSESGGLLHDSGSELHVYHYSEVGLGSILFRRLDWSSGPELTEPVLVNHDGRLLGAGDLAGVPYVCTRGNAPDDELIHFMLATDASGLVWEEKLELVLPSSANTACFAVIDGIPSIFRSSSNAGTFEIWMHRATDASGSSWNAGQFVMTTGKRADYLHAASIAGHPALLFSTYEFSGKMNLQYSRAQDATGSAWDLPQVLHDSRSAQALVELDSRPVVFATGFQSYGWDSRLYMLRGTDAVGSSWAAGTVLEDLGYLFEGLDYAVVNGLPVLCLTSSDGGLGQQNALFQAGDAAGLAWSPVRFDYEVPWMETRLRGLCELDGRLCMLGIGRDGIGAAEHPLRLLLKDN